MIKAIRNLTFGHPRTLVQPALWIFFEDFFNLFPSIIVYLVINILAEVMLDTGGFDLRTFIYFSVAMVILALFQFLIGFTAFRKSFIPVARHTADDRIAFVRKLRRLPLGFFSKKESGELINNFANDFVNIQQAVTGYLSGLFSVILSCILTSLFLFLFNPLMAAAFYLAIPLTTLLLILSMKTLERNSVRVATAKDKVATSLNEYLLGIKTLKSYNQTGEGFVKLKSAYHHLMQSCIKEESGSGSLVRLCTSIVQFGLPLMCITGSYLILGGRFSIVAFISLIIIGTKILAPIITVVSRMMSLRASYISAKRLNNTMTAPEMAGKKHSLHTPGLRFSNVSFSYNESGEKVIKDLSVTIPQGGLTALVGPSGSGKSTLLRLIARFWDPQEGSILCDGVPLSDIEPESWQKNISMVLQDVYLFHESIRENILFGRKDAAEEELIQAAKTAGCHEFITALPDGYNTIVGEGGSTLSGGEKQRISIARALLKKAPILLLDEPTASLDARNEVLIQQAVNALVKNTTVVMIAHRLKTIQRADQILVLDKGRIVEQGDHSELLKLNGLYARLWKMQQKSLDWSLS